MGSHAQRMAQNNALVGAAYEFKPMKAIEALRAGETKGNRFSRRERLDKVSDGTMPTVCANPQGTIKLHARPDVFWPQAIFFRRK